MTCRYVFQSVLMSACAVCAAAADYSSVISDTLQRLQPAVNARFTAVSQPIDDPSLTFIPASDSGFEYTGRIDMRSKDAPVLIWQGSQVRFAFSGNKIGFRFSGSSYRSWYNIIIDGKIYILKMNESLEYDYFPEIDLDNGEHECIIFKRTEALYAADTFLGVTVASSPGRLGQKMEPKKLKIEFLGDSITVGACNEVPHDDDYENLAEHNNYTSYAAITARLLDAEYSNLAVSGTGVCISWNELIISRTWKNLYAQPSGIQYDFSARKPDIVVVNLGQNDYGYPENKGEPFPSNFAEIYEKLLREIRDVYPDTWIISAIGGMSAAQSSRALITGLNKAVKNISDPKIVQFRFRSFTYNHPRIDTHEKLAYELEKFIRTNILDKQQN